MTLQPGREHVENDPLTQLPQPSNTKKNLRIAGGIVAVCALAVFTVLLYKGIIVLPSAKTNTNRGADAPQNGNTNTTQNSNEASTLNANTNTAITRPAPLVPQKAPPVPLSTWNPAYTATSSALKKTPSTLSRGKAICAAVPHTTWTDRDTQYDCYTDLSSGFRDPLVCDEIALEHRPSAIAISDDGIRNCIKGFANLYGNFDCAVYPQTIYRDWCYLTIASFAYVDTPTNDCGPIVSDDLRSYCERGLVQGSMSDALQRGLQSALDMTSFLFATCALDTYPDITGKMPNNPLSAYLRDRLNDPTGTIKCKNPSTEVETARHDLTTDTDHDGVVLFLENVYESSDSNKDTDGDGYGDYDEIMRGYRPNGQGQYEY
ncbi:MAG: hypothetical protein V1907_00850 [Candidatus Kerfeldbacteria bacterium]